MRKSDITFMVLGGGQSVGASCYFIKLGESNILLDCGIGMTKGIPYAPNINRLVESGLVESHNQIGQVYISHAHLDHIGYLHEYATQFQNPVIYMTDITKGFSSFQIKKTARNFYKMRRLIDREFFMANRVSCVSYRQSISFRDYDATFFEAGHIPGAMMTLFHFYGQTILYTGDYSLNPTFWTNGCQLPADDIDILVVCGLHARHPYIVQNEYGPDRIIREIYEGLLLQRPVYCRASQLSKGIELIRRIQTSRCAEYPIYIDDNVYGVVRTMESLGIPILNKNVSLFRAKVRNKIHIMIGTSQHPPNSSSYKVVQGDFTLHDNFDETVEFIKKVNPRIAFIVHSSPSRYGDTLTVEQKLLADPQCRTQCVFAENEDIYRI